MILKSHGRVARRGPFLSHSPSSCQGKCIVVCCARSIFSTCGDPTDLTRANMKFHNNTQVMWKGRTTGSAELGAPCGTLEELQASAGHRPNTKANDNGTVHFSSPSPPSQEGGWVGAIMEKNKGAYRVLIYFATDPNVLPTLVGVLEQAIEHEEIGNKESGDLEGGTQRTTV